MLSAKIVAQKPSGRVMPTGSPLQLVAAARDGAVADHDISITAATRRLIPPDHRTIELFDDKYLHRIVHLVWFDLHIHAANPPPRADKDRDCALQLGIALEDRE
jgi:hypothetical protein